METAQRRRFSGGVGGGCHLLVLQGNLGFDRQDQIGRGVLQLPDVLIDMRVQFQPHVVINVSVHQEGREEDVNGGDKK